jgi:hypothetical protein
MAKVAIKHEPPPGVELSAVPTIKGKDEAHRWIATVLRVPLRKNLVVTAANSRALPCVKIGGALYFSTQGLFDWVMSLTEVSA